MEEWMNKRTVIAATVLMALGVGAALLWRKLERAGAQTSVQASADPAVATHSDSVTAVAPATSPAATSHMTIKVKGKPRPNVPQVSSPADQRKHAELRQQLTDMNPQLAAELEITPEEAEQFLDLLASQRIQISVVIASRPGSIRDGVYSTDLRRSIRTMELAGDAEQASMLGGKYPLWLQHQEIQLQQSPVDQLQRMLARQGMGLSDAEFAPLAAALAAEEKHLGRDMPVAAQARRDPRQELLEQLQHAAAIDRQLVNVASRYLNRQQFEAYEQLLEQREYTAQRLLRSVGGAD
jgi:hypothetical protein